MIIENFNRLVIPAGTNLFSVGDAGSAAYLVESGCLEIYLERAGEDLVLARRGVGEIVGEMAILDRRPRSASARAIADTRLVVITEESVARRIDQTDPILKMCLGVVLARYRETVALLNQLESPLASQVADPANPTQFAAAFESLVLEREMRAALERAEFELFFQPIVNLATGTLAGFESLMRWRHPVHGLVPPSQFIPLAEACGFITDLTDFALADVMQVFPLLREAAAARRQGIPDPLFVSVNISGHDLSRPSFAPDLVAALMRSGIAPSGLKLEVTESVLMKEPERAAATLNACRQGEIGIAIDDFGTGYSSLSYLSTLPITTLKVDRAFVQAMLLEPKSRKIVQTILRLADELSIPVVAEGIERFAEAEALTDMGCALGQGFLFGRPAPLAPTLEIIRGWTAVRPTPIRAIAC